MNTQLEALEAIYAQYETSYAKAVAEAPICAGLLGMGESPKNAACHEVFYEAVGSWAKAFAEGGPSAEDAYKAVEQILKAADRCRDTGRYWYCYAAQGHAQSLIGFLTARDSETLQIWYDGAYPKLERMPVQKKIFQLLKKQAKQRQRFF